MVSGAAHGGRSVASTEGCQVDEVEIGRRGVPPVGGQGPSLRSEYQAWLDAIDDELIGGALTVSGAMPRITRAVLSADTSCVDEARRASAAISESCRHVEDEGFLLLAREAPVSGDLRRLVAILRLVHDVERSGRLMYHIAESVERLDARLLPVDLRQQLEELATRAVEVFRRGVDAWRQRDALAVHELDRLDSDVDRLRTGLLVHARELDGSPSEVLLLGLLARYYERVADHGVAFAEHVTFVVTGERVAVGP
jgi:phosphate transport system protein